MCPQSNQGIAKVFFALWPTAAERDSLAAWQKPLQKLCGGRAMRAETLHVTLVFVGEIEQSRLEALRFSAQEISETCFELCFDEVRYWAHNHIVYAAPAAVPQQLERLVGALKQSLALHRFNFEQSAYSPHVTLIRNARWPDAPKAGNPQPASGRGEPIPLLPHLQPVRWQSRDFALVQSIMQDGLASYRVLAKFPLGLG
jgi:RNA 2',3'-cyclic 3'-phosphodiesterase